MSTNVKKLSIASIHGPLTKEEKETIKAGDSIFVGRFFGVATGSKTGTSQYGPWTSLTGSFAGINSDGEEFRAAQCLLPLGIPETIAAQLAQDSVSEVHFSVDIFAKYKKIGNEDGHEYFSKSHETPSAEDPLIKMASALPQLPVAVKQLAIAGESEKVAAQVAEEKPATGKAKK